MTTNSTPSVISRAERGLPRDAADMERDVARDIALTAEMVHRAARRRIRHRSAAAWGIVAVCLLAILLLAAPLVAHGWSQVHAGP
jgi:hypothetical protein